MDPSIYLNRRQPMHISQAKEREKEVHTVVPARTTGPSPLGALNDNAVQPTKIPQQTAKMTIPTLIIFSALSMG